VNDGECLIMLKTLYVCLGAIALKNLIPILDSTHRYVSITPQCSGLESNITNCTQTLNEVASCPSDGIGSVSCYGKLTLLDLIRSVPLILVVFKFEQWELFPMHPALMEQYDSAMGISQERAGWRSASTMPGALSVMMGGTMQMHQ